MRIEPMNSTHVSEVAELEKMCFSAPWSEKSVASELENPLSLWLVATEQDRVLGYVGSQTVLGESDMMNLAVAPAARCQGIGRQLVEALAEALQKNGSHCLTLEVRQSNLPAQKLYGALGFQQIGRRPGYYSNPKEDALILRKEWRL